MIYQVKGISGHQWVCVGGVHVSVGVRGCAQVCMGVCRYVKVSAGMHGCVWVCASVCGCGRVCAGVHISGL